jgi:hypothetical protein
MTLCSVLLHIYWYVLPGQGAVPKSLAIRIVYLTSYMMSLVILVAYSAALISFLTVQRTVLPFETLEEFFYDGTYDLQILPGAEISYFHVSYTSYHTIHSPLFLRVFYNSKSYAKII